ncbi:MAG: hypothetical protein GF353_21415 [Candidatus Lokiarchaeota archaeon]|nr:hypothetical protein [Candidatus Lokiarchaeota archaeon]
MDEIEKAVECFNQGFRCSQAILSTYGVRYDLDSKMALKLASPFGAGIGSSGQICGAISGAIMVLGLHYGNDKVSQIKKKEKAYSVTREFISEFKSNYKTVQCKELLNCDLSTIEGRTRAIKEGLFRNLCPKFVRSACQILEKFL